MLMRLFALLSVFAGAALVGSAQQQQPPSTGSGAFGSKQRTYDVPTPGTLGRLRTEAAPRPSPGTTGVTVPVPNVWEVDPATGAQYRRGQVLVRFDEYGTKRLALVPVAVPLSTHRLNR